LLKTSTKAKRARVERENRWSTSSDDDPGISPVKLLPTTRTSSRASSTYSVEGKLVATLFQVSNRSESLSSLEGEINFASETSERKHSNKAALLKISRAVLMGQQEK